MTIEIGSTVEGTVVKVADYGAIVRLAGGRMGLVHISEVADTFVRDVRDYVKENDRITVKVLKMNNKGRYELSAKQADAVVKQEGAVVDRSEEKPRVQAVQTQPRPQPMTLPEREFPMERIDHQDRMPLTFEDKLSRFMKDSQERILDVKRNVDSKRGLRRR